MPVRTSKTTKTVEHTFNLTAAELREHYGLPDNAKLTIETPGTPASYPDSHSVSAISVLVAKWKEISQDV